MCAPAAFTPRAVSINCSRDSTEHGPAITTRLGPPIFTPLTSTTVRCGCSSRLTSVNGCDMEMISSTPGATRKRFDFAATPAIFSDDADDGALGALNQVG